MKIIISLFTATALIAAGCNNNDNTANTETVLKDTVVATPPTADAGYAGCYQMIIGKDTADMNLKDSAGFYTGTLNYKRYEKDSNKGNVILKKENDKLDGWYRFMSEGMATVRQINFNIIAGELAEGYGDVGMLGDSVYYKHPETLQYEEKHPFKKVNCP